MLSACSASFLPLVSVSVYGTGPGFLLRLFSSRSSGQETVNTHSTAPTHKSEQRAGIYIQISNVEGKERKDRTNRVCGTAGTFLETKCKCQQISLLGRKKPLTPSKLVTAYLPLKDEFGTITFSLPQFIYKSGKMHITLETETFNQVISLPFLTRYSVVSNFSELFWFLIPHQIKQQQQQNKHL